jgi:hypothetical protein
MAPPPIMTMTDFDLIAYNVKTNLVPGERIKAVQVNNKDGEPVSGRVQKIYIDYQKQRVRITMRTDDMKVVEIYPETIYRVDRDTFENLNHVPTISGTGQFIKYILS